MVTSSLCDRCEEGGILAVHDSPSMETKFGFSSDCERNVNPAHKRVLQATSYASHVKPCQVTNEATPSHQQIKHDTFTRSQVSHSLIVFYNGGVSLPTE